MKKKFTRNFALDSCTIYSDFSSVFPITVRCLCLDLILIMTVFFKIHHDATSISKELVWFYTVYVSLQFSILQGKFATSFLFNVNGDLLYSSVAISCCICQVATRGNGIRLEEDRFRLVNMKKSLLQW